MTIKKENRPAATSEEPAAPFQGYTMEELKYQRAMMALRKEFCKAKMLQSAHALRPGSGKRSQGKGKSKLAFAGQIASKIFSNLNTLDYILMGISLFGTARKGIRLIKGKK